MKRIILLLLLSMGFLYLFGEGLAKLTSSSPGNSGGVNGLKKITIEQVINGSNSLYNPLPSDIKWIDDYHFVGTFGKGMSKVNAQTGKREVFVKTTEEGNSNFAPNYELIAQNADFSKMLYEKDDEIGLRVNRGNQLQPLISAKDPLGNFENITFSPDSSHFAFIVDGNLFIFDIDNKKKIQLTKDGNTDILNGYASWVYYEEILGRSSRYKAFWWSPDSSKIAFMRFDQTFVPDFPIYTESGDYGKTEHTKYPKAGYPNPTVKIGIVTIKTGAIEWVDFDDPNEHYLAFPVWDKNSNKLYFQWMNRGQDHLKILYWDQTAKKTKSIYEEQQKAWVDFFEDKDFSLLGNGDFLIRSSRDGWYHLYYLGADGKYIQLTSGHWSVSSIEGIDEKNATIFFCAAKEDSTETHFYRMNWKSKVIKKLTDFKGTHAVDLSPSMRYFIDRYSSINTPSRMELRDTQGNFIRKIADSYSPEIEKYEMANIALTRVKTSDGFDLPVILYLPKRLDPNKKYPVVLTIYGGPGASIVSNSDASTGYRKGLEKHFLAQEGIINVFADNRASGHFGKKGMEMIHRQLGKWELNDFIQVVKYLKTLPYVDPEKIGIKGHSYGGYMAAFALTNGAEYFKFGISGSPVIDWKLYDSVYTERFMDTPQENPEGYKQSSVLTHASKFNGVMRLTHGTLDDNVHLQNTLQLVDKLLDLGKTPELMIYPGNYHGIGGKKKDEYMRADIEFWLKHFFGKKLPDH